jgi:hypothetical protein
MQKKKIPKIKIQFEHGFGRGRETVRSISVTVKEMSKMLVGKVIITTIHIRVINATTIH